LAPEPTPWFSAGVQEFNGLGEQINPPAEQKPGRMRCKPSSVPPSRRATAPAAKAIYLDPPLRTGSSRSSGKAAYPRPSA